MPYEPVTVTFDPFLAGCLLIVSICALIVWRLDVWDKARRPPKDEAQRMLWECARKGPPLPELAAIWMTGWCDHAFGSRGGTGVLNPDKGFYGHGKNAPPEDDIIKRGVYEHGYRCSRDRDGYHFA